MVRPRIKTGRERTRKHSEETRELALILYHHTPLIREEVARLLHVKPGAVRCWWDAEKKENPSPHRKGKGSAPGDPQAILEKENAELREEVKKQAVEIAKMGGVVDFGSSGGTEHLIRRSKIAMASLIDSPATKLGELASTVRALAEIEEIERMKNFAEHAPQIIFYVPDDSYWLTPEKLLQKNLDIPIDIPKTQ